MWQSMPSWTAFNPFPNTPFWDRPKFKEAADDNWNMAIKEFKDTDYIEKIVETGKIAHFDQFHPFPQCFPKAFFFNMLKWVYMEERVNKHFAQYSYQATGCFSM